MTTTAEAYAEVERLTRRRARNFAYGIMVLPRPKRRAIAAIYAFARRVDDIADGELPVDEKRARLEELHGLLDGPPGDDFALVALADARGRYPIPDAALHSFVDGGLQDLETTRYRDLRRPPRLLPPRRRARSASRACRCTAAATRSSPRRSASRSS